MKGLKFTILLLSTCILSFDLNAQTIQLDQDTVLMHSLLHHMSDAEPTEYRSQIHPEDPNKSGVDIYILTAEKRIWIKDLENKEVLYDIAYMQSFQGEGTSVSLRPSQTMFMCNDKLVQMVVHDAESKTLNVIYHDNRIELFGYLSLKE